MSQDSRFKFDRMLDNDPTVPEPDKQGDNYSTIGHVRNLGFVLSDGRKFFLNYSYLVSGEYRPAEGKIVLAFTSHEITMRGIMLDSLYDAVMSHVIRIIRWRDKRYNGTLLSGEYAINEITIVSNNL